MTTARAVGGQISVPVPHKSDNYVKQGSKFKGYGKDKCEICGQPTRNHSILETCSTPPATRVTR